MENYLMPTKTCWMLVDDNVEILRTMSLALKTLTNLEVQSFSSATTALAAFQASPEKYELVITDYEMPEINGVELCRQMRAVIPHQKIILATGGGFFTAVSAQQIGFCALLNKPFPLVALQSALALAGVGTEMLCAV